MYLELANLPKIISTKLDQGKDRGISQVLIYIQKYKVPKPFKKYYDGNCSHNTFSMPGKDYNSN